MTLSPILSSPSASVFLDAFRPLTHVGSQLFPVPQESQTEASGFTVSQRELTRETIPAFIRTSRRLVDEVEQILNDEAMEMPHRLSATNGHWAIDEFGRMGPSACVNLTRASGEFLFLGDTGGAHEIFIGRRAQGVIYGLANTIDLQRETISSSYPMAWFAEGVGRLRAKLKMMEAPLYEVALAMAGQIYLSGQYPSDLSPEWMTLQDVALKRLYGLKGSEGGVSLAENVSPNALTALKMIDVNFGGPPDAGGGVLVSEAFSKDAGEYLAISLQDETRRRLGETTPLHPTLQDRLWGLAEILANSRPIAV